MRSILNVSLPNESLKKEIQERASQKGINVSAYVVYALKMEKQMISEEQILKMAKKANQDYKNKKTKTLKSLADLI